MKNHKDLMEILRSNGLRITPARRSLLQFFLDNKFKQISLADINGFVDRSGLGLDRSSVYRNIEVLKAIGVIQELNLPKVGKRFEYVIDRKVHHFYICKSCGKANRGNQSLFAKIETALKDVHGFTKANMSVVFYGICSRCSSLRKAKQ